MDLALVELSFINSKEAILSSKSLTHLLTCLSSGLFKISSGGLVCCAYLSIINEVV